MPRYITTKSNFLGGEISGRAQGRSDIAQVQAGANQIRNFIVMPDGGVTRRPGTRHVSLLDGALTGVRIIPFVVSRAESYVIKIYTKANVNYFEVADVKTNAAVTITVGTNPPLDLTGRLDGIQYVQSADVMFLACRGVPPFIIYRQFVGGVISFQVDRYVEGAALPGTNKPQLRMAFLDENLNNGPTITPSGTAEGSTITLTASNNEVFTPDSPGSYYRIGPILSPGYVVVTSYTNATTVQAKVIAALPSTAATQNWAEGAWSPRRGYPAAVGMYNQRLVFGGTTSKPDTFWLSQVGDFYEMNSQGSTAITSAQNYTLSDGRVDNIQWIVGGKKLTIGTVSGETVGVVEADGTNLRIQFAQETAHGSAYIQPQRVSNAIPFVQGSGHRVREMVFDFGSDSYVSNDVTLLRSDIAEGFWNKFFEENKIRQLAYQEAPNPIFWTIDDAGFLYGITRERQQQIAAWHTHLLGGSVSEMAVTGLNGPPHQAMVQTICVTPDPTGAGDRLWMVVKREVNGALQYSFEYMDRFRYMDQLVFAGNTGEGWFYFMDACKGVYSNTPVSEVTGFSHLAGEMVGVMVDGKYQGKKLVALDGKITFDTPGRAVVAGYTYRSRLKTTRMDGGSNVGSATGAIRRVDDVRVGVYKTRFWKYGFEGEAPSRMEIVQSNLATQSELYDAKLEPHRFTDPQELVGEPFYTETGIVPKAAPNGYDRKSVGIIMADEPYPCSIVHITIRAVEQDV